MTPRQFHIKKYNLNEKDFKRLIELGQIKEVDYELMEEYHQARLKLLGLHNVGNSVICDDWIHEERVKQNDDTYCPVCGKQLQIK